MGRQPCCDKVGLKRGPWTIDEDQKLISFILNNGIHCWRTVPKLAGLLRCGKSCRLRWINYLRPDLKRGDFSEDEENQLIQLHSRLGNKWSKIASHFPGRTDNEIKNHWNTRIKKRLSLVGVEEERSSPTESSKAIEEIGRGETKGTEKEHDDEFESIILDELPSSNDLYNVVLSGNSNFSTTMTQSGSFSSNNNYSASVSEDINSQYDRQQQWPLETTVDSYGWENLDSYLGHDEFFYFQNL